MSVINKRRAGFKLDGEPAKFERGGFFETAHDIHGLNGRTGCAFHQVVNSGHTDYSAAGRIKIKADIDEISAGQDLWFGHTVNAAAIFDQADKRLGFSPGPEDPPEILFSYTRLDVSMGDCQGAPYQVNRGNRQVDVGNAQFLDDLGSMAVAIGRECAHDAAALGVVRAGVGGCATL